jgi:imidazole glycerol phosphate synthase subunit HisF
MITVQVQFPFISSHGCHNPGDTFNLSDQGTCDSWVAAGYVSVIPEDDTQVSES